MHSAEAFVGGVILRTLILLVLLRSCFGKTVPANFVFGDSLVDAGNNNYILTLSKANYVPNGIDFGRPTGRFTNGRTIIDIIVEELGFKDYTPPYLAPETVGTVVLKGVNYASGAGGILNRTGEAFGGRINLDAQLDNFANTRQDIIANIGTSSAMVLFRTSLFTVSIGSNDFINNYLTPVISAAKQRLISPEEFVNMMITRYRQQLLRLYKLGARKVLVSNVGPIGCIPYEKDINSGLEGQCIDFPNQMAQLFNIQLRSLIMDLSFSLEGSKLIYADVYGIFEDIISNYTSYGFEDAESSCCHAAGRFGGLVPCGPTSEVCTDRSKYVFWDPYHPTDAANVIIAKRLMDGDIQDISPMNIRQLVEL